MSVKARQAQADADAHRARTAARDTARHALPCAECGSPDGLVGWPREIILEFIENDGCKLPRDFYVAIEYNLDRLYTPCPVCHAATAEVLSRCILLDATGIAAWLTQGWATEKRVAQIETKWRQQ